jgi:hypothetical protein
MMITEQADEVRASREPCGENAADVLERLAGTARYYRAEDGRLHARVPVENRHEVYALKSKEFREWLVDAYRLEQSEFPPERTVVRVLSSLETRARLDRRMPAMQVRVARGGDPDQSFGDYYVDLGDESGQAVKIGLDGWSVIDHPPVPFRRPKGLLALPYPSRGGSIDRLKAYINLNDADFRLLLGWLATALLPHGPYPVLAIHGEQGSTKSTLAQIIRLLIDPQSSPVVAHPRSVRDLMVCAFGGWLLSFDNISTLPIWLSDSLCQVATGGGFAGRALFSDSDRTSVYVRRPVILNGIDEFVRREDLADRCVFLHLPRVDPSERRTEVEFWPAFHSDYPAILGALFDLVVGGLRELSTLELKALPRMADFARFGEAIGRSLQWPDESFLKAYCENRQAATLLALEESPVAQVLIENASLGGLRGWTASATEMLRDLNSDTPRRMKNLARWPKSARELGNELRRIAPLLRTRGISVEFSRTPANRVITISRQPRSEYSSVIV